MIIRRSPHTLLLKREVIRPDVGSSHLCPVKNGRLQSCPAKRRSLQPRSFHIGGLQVSLMKYGPL